jgi:hypothetical protein
MKKMAVAWTASLFLQANSMASLASSIFYPINNTLEINNDSDDATYLKVADCSTILFTDPANRFPWGKDSVNETGTWLLNDQKWGPNSKKIVKRIESWKNTPRDQKIQISKEPSTMRQCLDLLDIRRKELETAQKREKDCVAQKKSMRSTSAGQLCLSDVEYMQIYNQEQQILLERKRIEAIEENAKNSLIIDALRSYIQEKRQNDILDSLQQFSNQQEQERRYRQPVQCTSRIAPRLGIPGGYTINQSCQ